MDSKRTGHFINRYTISLALLVFGYAWILFTEFISIDYVDGMLSFFELQLFKGLLFITIAAAGVYTLLYIRDKRIEETERFADSILKTADVPIAVINEDDTFRRINRAFEESFGYRSDEIKGKSILEIIPNEYKKLVGSSFHNILEESSSATKEWDVIDKQGNKIPVVINAGLLESAKYGKMLILALTDISEQKEIQQKLKQSLKEKEVLLSEVHHRVKNNLAVISGISQLQAFQEDDKQIQEILSSNVNRIQAIASVHELLYQSESLSMLALDELLKNMIEDKYHNVLQDDSKNIDFELDLDAVGININQAIPCALIINEMISNAYARSTNGGGTISLSLEENGDRVVIGLDDNRKDLGDTAAPDDKMTLSEEMIETLTKQLDGSFDQNISTGGITSILVFEKADIKGVGSANIQ